MQTKCTKTADSVDKKSLMHVLREVENLKVGVMNAQSGCDLPRNRKQVYNFNFL